MDNHINQLKLPAIRYFHLLGDEDQLITYLNCFQSCVYNYLITEQNVKSEDIYEIFLCDINCVIIEDMDGSIYDISFSDTSVNPLGFKIVYTLGQGMETLAVAENILKARKALIVQMYMQRVPYFINYIGYDFALDEAYYRQNYYMFHTFLAMGFDRDHLYYVDSPYLINKERYLPYENNQSIGVISKKELIPAIDSFFNYSYLQFDEDLSPDRLDNLKLDVVKTLIAKSVTNYQPIVREIDGKKYYYGKAALDRLSEHFQNGTMDLQRKVDQFNINLDQLLIWKLQFVMNRRYILARTLEKFAGRLNSGEIGGLVTLLNTNIKSWRILISKLKKIQARKENSYSGLSELSGKISLLEAEIIDIMGKLA